jgi:hypothetical protein
LIVFFTPRSRDCDAAVPLYLLAPVKIAKQQSTSGDGMVAKRLLQPRDAEAGVELVTQGKALEASLR